MGKEIEKLVNDYVSDIDMPLVNEILDMKGLKDFEMNKTTLRNISEWALNGSSDEEIRKKLDLNPSQWKLLVSVCPTLLYVMKDSRALADIIIVGSMFQMAIGGKRIRKQVAKSVTEYNENGKPCGQHLETIELWEELPPNADLLKFMAKNKLSEKFGDNPIDTTKHFTDIVSSMTAEEKAIIEMSLKGEDDENKH